MACSLAFSLYPAAILMSYFCTVALPVRSSSTIPALEHSREARAEGDSVMGFNYVRGHVAEDGEQLSSGPSPEFKRPETVGRISARRWILE